MTDTPSLRWRLRNPELLRTLMQNTGDGSRATVRDLAEHAGCYPSHIGELLTGEQETASYEHATGVCARIGVDLLVLWAPVERSDTAVRGVRQLQRVAV